MVKIENLQTSIIDPRTKEVRASMDPNRETSSIEDRMVIEDCEAA